MLDRLLGFKIHDYLHPLGLLILAFGLPMNKVLMSIGTIWLISNLILKANFKAYWSNIKANFVFWSIFAIFLMHIVGLFYTSDFNYAFRDINSKLPLFVIVPVLIAYPIQKRFLNFILYGFLLSLLITSVINYIFILQNENVDYRLFSQFGSHIRYSLLIVMGVAICCYLIVKLRKGVLIWSTILIWLTYYTFISKVFSGYIAFFFLLFAGLFYMILNIKNTTFKVGLVVLYTSLFAFSFQQLYTYLIPDKPYFSFEELADSSVGGEKYYNDTTSLWFENGHHIMSQIAGKELKNSWENRSNIPYEGKTTVGTSLKSTLFRYMASKNIKKDSVGMLSLTETDIQNIEKGMTSVVLSYSVPRIRLARLKDELFHYYIGGDPDGNSLLQRIEHWKTGALIIQEHWLFGVGTGDIQTAFNRKYASVDSQLDKKHWNRTHNQFMTFWISFGIIGFIIFIGFWLYFVWQSIHYQNLLGFLFSAIAISSFLAEDTIETQQGVTFIALFLGVSSLIFNAKRTSLKVKRR